MLVQCFTRSIVSLNRARSSTRPMSNLSLRSYGALSVRRRLFNSTDKSLVVELLTPGGESFGALIRARVCRVEDGSLLIDGTEVKPRRASLKSACDYHPQRWMCKPDFLARDGQPQVIPSKFTVDAQRISGTGFDPSADDCAD